MLEGYLRELPFADATPAAIGKKTAPRQPRAQICKVTPS